jgi:hypothetical protein
VVPADSVFHLCYAHGPTTLYSDEAATLPITHEDLLATTTVYFDDTVEEDTEVRIIGRYALADLWNSGHCNCQCVSRYDDTVTVVYTTV